MAPLRSRALLLALLASLPACGGGGGGGGSVAPPGSGPGGGGTDGGGTVTPDPDPQDPTDGQHPQPGPRPLGVVSVSPARQALAVSRDAVVRVTFDRRVDPMTVDGRSVRAFGRWSGAAHGTPVVSADGRSITLAPERPFSAGESVTVTLASTLRSLAGGALERGHGFTFRVASGTANLALTETQSFSTRSSDGLPTKVYGGMGADLDGDGLLDLAVVNEISNDLRVFPNAADGTARFGSLLEPTFYTGPGSSPNEPADFDADGRVDAAIASHGDDTVSVLLGNGDMTFGRAQRVPVGLNPRGLAVLDADGDGAPTGTGAVALLANDGTGAFDDARFVDVGVATPWALTADDMDGDGRMDLGLAQKNAKNAKNADRALTRSIHERPTLLPKPRAATAKKNR